MNFDFLETLGIDRNAIPKEGDLATVTFQNGYTADVTTSLSLLENGKYEVALLSDDKVCHKFEQNGSIPFIKGINSYLSAEEVEEICMMIADLPQISEEETIFPVSRSNVPLESLVRRNERPVQRLNIEHCRPDELERYEDEVKAFFSYDSETNTYYVESDVWAKELRPHGEYHNPSDPRYISVAIGGSDLSALFDGSELSKQLYLYEGQHGSKYKSAIELFYEKTGQKMSMTEPSKEDIFFVGHVLEPAVKAYFEKKYREDHPDDTLTLVNDMHMYQCGRKNDDGTLKYPYILCDLDATIVINGIKGVFEAKTCQYSSPDRPLWQQGIVPLHYYLQVVWYMACTNLPYAYIACLTGMDVQDLVYIYIERDFEIEDAVLDMAQKFVNLVLTGTEPDLSDQNIDRLYTMWRKKMGPYRPQNDFVKLDDSKLPAVEKILKIKSEIGLLSQKIENLKKNQKELLVEEIFPVFGDANKGSVRIDDESWYNIHLRKASRSVNFDEERLRADHEEIYEKYLSYPSKSYAKKLLKTNRAMYEEYIKAHKPKFDGRKFMNEHPELVDEYYVPDTELTDAKMNYIEIEYRKKGDPE